MLSGYKTYLLGASTIFSAVAAYLAGLADLNTTVQLVITAAMGMFIRDGINTAVAKIGK